MDAKLSDRSKGAKPPLTIRILIADDGLSSRDLLRYILESSGYEVAEARDGVQVLEKASAFEPHLMILDLQMPRLDGYATATALRKIPAFEKTPIIALTAAFSDSVPERIVEAGFTGYLAKPIGPAQLRGYITSLL